MIARLTGTIAERELDHVVLDVHGVGYLIAISAQTASTLPQIGAACTLCIHTHVREDQFSLFGFATTDERTIFLRLLSVSGIGPKLALSILSGMAAPELVQAVVSEDAKQLATIPGIGKKTAERIVVDLKDRFLNDHASLLMTIAPSAVRPTPPNADALSALLNLGYSQMQAEQALRAASTRVPNATLSVLIKDALKELAQR